MKVSVEWLKEYVDFSGSYHDLVDSLPMLGLEVEELGSESSNSLDNVVVGEVLTKENHPEADRLSVCSVSFSDDYEPASIVCGLSLIHI